MQAIDHKWLAEKGFVFHHHRAAGHGEEISDGEQMTDGVAHPERNRAELVYYLWPSETEEDVVPPYCSSIEGVTGLCLSPDETEVLVFWEKHRGVWGGPGGTVNAGEMKYDALMRECFEEARIKLDENYEPFYLGGWQAGKARDLYCNDNFTCLTFKSTTKVLDLGGELGEVTSAVWVPWRPLLAAWQEVGEPDSGKLREWTQSPGGEAMWGKPEKMSAALAEVYESLKQQGVELDNTKMTKFSMNIFRWLKAYATNSMLKCRFDPPLGQEHPPPKPGKPRNETKKLFIGM